MDSRKRANGSVGDGGGSKRPKTEEPLITAAEAVQSSGDYPTAQSVHADDDLISQLADDILHIILSLLSFQDAARTSLVSTLWRRLWATSTIHLDDSSLRPLGHQSSGIRRWRLDTLRRIVSSHNGTIQSCSLYNFAFPLTLRPTAEGLLQSILQRGTQELLLSTDPGVFLLPKSLLTCGDSLSVLELRNCIFPAHFSHCKVRLTQLRVLHLHGALLSDTTLHHLVSHCPILETLVISDCRDLQRVEIRSQTLCSLILKSHFLCKLEEVFVNDAPNLEHLVLDERLTTSTRVRLMHTSKLTYLGIINAKVRSLQLGKARIERNMPSSLSTRVHSLKVVAIRVDFSDNYQNKMASDLLKCFPCLETLDVMIVNTNTSCDEHLDYWEQHDSSACLKFHLRSVKLKGFLGHKADTEFAKFLLTRAQVLELMAIFCYYTPSESWVEAKRTDLCLENRASANAEVVITKDEDRGYKFSTWKQLF